MNQRMEIVITRLFSRLQGIYGTTFTGKFSTGIGKDGTDAGLENAKAVWAEELAGFADNLDAIGHALQNVDPRFPPSSREFLALCRQAPRKEAPALPYKPTAEDEARAKKAREAAMAALKPKTEGGIDRLWATSPRSEQHLRFIFDAAKNDPRFRPCIAEMVERGICTAGGKLLRACA